MDIENQHMDPTGLLPKIFSGEATPEEKERIDRWIAEDPANRAEFEAFGKLWNLSGNAKGSGDIDVEAEWKHLERNLFPVEEKRIFLKIWQAAAVIILLSGIAFLAYRITAFSTQKASSASLASVELPDGTLMVLNAGSSVTYKKGFGHDHRNLKLKGEAWFEVKKNPSLPFIISAGDARIRVTGTKFNVKAYHRQDVKVTVTEGTVRLSAASLPASQVTLTAEQTGVMNAENRQVHGTAASDMNDLAWRTRIMQFDNTSLAEAAMVLSDAYHYTIRVDENLRACSVTVRFENKDLDAVLEVLKSTLNLTVTKKGKKITISGKGC
jgi:transmembrane sensor